MIVRAFLISLITLAHAAWAGYPSDYMTLKDTEGREIFARIVAVEGDGIKIERQDMKRFDLPFERLSESSRERVAGWISDNVSATIGKLLVDGEPLNAEVLEQLEKANTLETADDGKLYRPFYPRSRSEVKAGIREIESRKRPDDVDKSNFEAVTELNVFRFLCGVSDDVKISPKLADYAQEAAEACAKAGEISHDLGHYTNQSNLSSGVGNAAKTVSQYIADNGDNNREKRGHRRWCLYPKLSATGFGVEGGYSAMHCFEHEGSELRDSHAYPGKGFFPAERVLGNAWSLYLTEPAPPVSELTVEVFQLGKRPTGKFGWSEAPSGRKMPVPYVYSYANTINFEPDSDTVNRRGVYLVRITGGGIREQYVTELF